MLRAGAIQVCVTPPVGVELAGYGPRIGRFSKDIHDDLTAQALVLDDGASRYAIVTSDFIAVSETFVQQIRQDVARRTRIPAAHVMVSCIHSHTAPTLHPFRDWGTPDRAYARSAARIIAGAIVAAENRLQPAKLSAAASSYPDLAWNRTGGDLADPTVEVLRLDTESGEPMAVLVHYACHPVMLGPKPVISADYPGALRRALGAQFPGAAILFANGACGDIDPMTNRRAWGSATFDEVERAGQGLAAVVVEALKSAERITDTVIDARQGTVTLPLTIPTSDAIRERIAHYSAEARALGNQQEDFKEVTGEVKMPRFWLRYYQALQQRIEAGEQPSAFTAELQAFRIGDAVGLIAIPAEVYTQQGMAIRAASPFRHTLPICYANGTFGYFPPRAEFEKGGYTAILAAAAYDAPPYQSDVADRLVEAVKPLLK